MLKMEWIAHSYHLSDQQVEEFVSENLPAKYFVGLAINQRAPNYATRTAFHERLRENGKLAAFEEMLEEIVQIVLRSGVQFATLQLRECIYNTAKDKKQQDKNGNSTGEVTTKKKRKTPKPNHQVKLCPSGNAPDKQRFLT